MQTGTYRSALPDFELPFQETKQKLIDNIPLPNYLYVSAKNIRALVCN